MYFYDPYGARPSGRYYRMPDNQEPVFPETSSPDTVFAPELGDQVVEGFSPMDLLNLGPPGERDIVLDGLPINRSLVTLPMVDPRLPLNVDKAVQEVPDEKEAKEQPDPAEYTQQVLEQRVQLVPIEQQERQVASTDIPVEPQEEFLPESPPDIPVEPQVEEQPQASGGMEMIVVAQPSKVEERREIVDQFSDSRVNSMFMDTSQTIDDGLEHPGYGVADDELTPTATEGIHVLPDQPESKEDPAEQHEEQDGGFYQYGSQRMSDEAGQDVQGSTPTSLTDQPSDQPTPLEPPKTGAGVGIPGWLLIGGGVLLISWLLGKKSG